MNEQLEPLRDMQFDLRVIFGHFLNKHVGVLVNRFELFSFIFPLFEQLICAIFITHEEYDLHNYFNHEEIFHIALPLLIRKALRIVDVILILKPHDVSKKLFEGVEDDGEYFIIE